MEVKYVIGRLCTFIFCIYTLMNVKLSLFSLLILLFLFLFETNTCLLNFSVKRSLNFYKNNIILTLGIIILIFLNFSKSEMAIYRLRNIMIKFININFNYVYLIIFILLSICLMTKSILNYLRYLDYLKNENKGYIKNELLSFRKKELENLKIYLKDENIQTILLDGKIGNGKTEIVENLVQGLDEENNDKFESIYLKLPLVENIEELKNIIILELKNIFEKYGINSNYLNDFLRTVSVFKTNFFELNFSRNRNNNWSNIQSLKRDLQILFKNKNIKILIILDDIEREEDPEKIKKSLYFLGELSEYFRNTKTTVLFLAQYEKIIEKLNQKIVCLNETGCKCSLNNVILKEEYDRNLLDKYFGYVMKVGEIDLEDFIEDDIKILLGSKFGTEDIDNSYIKVTTDLLTNFSKIYKNEIKNLKFSEETLLFLGNIRNVKRFLKQVKIMTLWKDYKNTLWLTINIVNLIDIFLDSGNSEGVEIKEKIKEKLFNIMMLSFDKSIKYNLIEKEAISIEKLLKDGKEFSEEFIINIEKAIKIIDQRIYLDEEIKLDYLGEKAIFEYIGDEKRRLNNFFESKIKINKVSILEKIYKMKIEDLNFLSNKAKGKFKKILLTRELTILEEEEQNKAEYYEEDNINIDEEIEKAKEKDRERRKKILFIINKDEFFEQDKLEIKKILEQEFYAEEECNRYYFNQPFN